MVSAARSEFPFTHRRQVGIVAKGDRDVKPVFYVFAQRELDPPRDVRSFDDNPSVWIYGTRSSYADRFYTLVIGECLSDEADQTLERASLRRACRGTV
jgi:hypothetical protein